MIDDETINRWRANYGLVERNPIQAAQFWEMTNGGMAPAGAVAALGICLDELAEMQAELAEARRERDELVSIPDELADRFHCLAHAHQHRWHEALCSAKFQLDEAQRDLKGMHRIVAPMLKYWHDGHGLPAPIGFGLGLLNSAMKGTK